MSPADVEFKPNDYEMVIRLTTDVPLHCAPQRLPHMEKIEVQKIVMDCYEKV